MATKSQQLVRADTRWKVAITLAIIAGLWFVWPYVGIICFAAISAYLFYPLYRWIGRYMPSMAAAAVTVLSGMLVILVPVALILVLAVAQGVSFATTAAHVLQAQSTGSLQGDVEAAIAQVNTVLEPISAGQWSLSLEAIQSFFANTMPELLKALGGVLLTLASSIPVLFTTMTLYLFLFLYMLAKGAGIIDDLRVISPFDRETTSLYFSRMGAMIKASMVSQLLIAFILAILAALTLLVFIGGGNYFFFMVGVLTILNMVPLGSAPLIYVICAVAIASGNISGGIWTLIIYQLVICNIDNLMRPRLIPKSVRLNAGLMVLSVFSGLYYFGALGLVYGPLVIIILLTTYETYVGYVRDGRSGVKLKEA